MNIQTYELKLVTGNTIELPMAKISGTYDVAKIAESLGYTQFAEEHSGVLCMNDANDIIGYYEVGKGSIRDVASLPLNILRMVALTDTTHVIRIHNHPSSKESLPSMMDVRAMLYLRDVLALVDVQLVDDVVIAGDGRTDHEDSDDYFRSVFTTAIADKCLKDGHEIEDKDKDAEIPTKDGPGVLGSHYDLRKAGSLPQEALQDIGATLDEYLEMLGEERK